MEERWNKSYEEAAEMYAKKRLGAAAVILNNQGWVLLVKHSYGRLNWELPGGAAEVDESIVETALREVREETGLQVMAKHTTGIYYEPEVDMLHFVFWCYPQEGTFNLRPDNEEISQCAFWPPDALPRPISDFTSRRIADAVSGVTLPLPTVITTRQWLD
jgi:8-oxo-dGTP pyrophosphatase MutT (NUDIX family)